MYIENLTYDPHRLYCPGKYVTWIANKTQSNVNFYFHNMSRLYTEDNFTVPVISSFKITIYIILLYINDQ
jgi:hypothetical protein